MAQSVATNAQLPTGGAMSIGVSDSLTLTAVVADAATLTTTSVTDGQTLTTTVNDQAET